MMPQDSALRAAMREIADSLGEIDRRALRQPKALLASMGREWCDVRVGAAHAAHAASTMLCADGMLRTLGGGFFHAARQTLPEELRAPYFPMWQEIRAKRKATKVQPVPEPVPKPTAPAVSPQPHGNDKPQRAPIPKEIVQRSR